MGPLAAQVAAAAVAAGTAAAVAPMDADADQVYFDEADAPTEVLSPVTQSAPPTTRAAAARAATSRAASSQAASSGGARAARPGIDYSKWDKIVDSDDDD